jgi:hypothetical protein
MANSEKKIIIEIFINDKDQVVINRSIDGFNHFECIGLVESVKQEIIKDFLTKNKQ